MWSWSEKGKNQQGIAFVRFKWYCGFTMQILRNKLYQVKVFSKDTKKCVRIIGENGLTPKKLDIVEDGLIKDLNWSNFWIETVEFNRKLS